ncbi:MAG: ATP-binding protein [Leptospiraceae bacterium]|nr:ATP-binding protein [Leptospiraceae bacterium]
MTPEEIENKQLVHSNKEDEFAIFRKEISPENPMTEIESIHTINLEFNKVENSPAKPLILIVDDDANVREALKITLGKKYDLILCANGNEAIEKVNLPFFAVILDIKMEGKNGFETFIEIKKKKLYLPIIFHSAYQDLKDPYEIINDYRPFGYVVKEGESKKLLDTIESAVDYFFQINRNATLVKELEKSEKQYRDLVENSLDIIFALDEQGRIISINHSVTQILRYPIEEILNTSIVNLAYKSNSANGEILDEKLQELSLSNNVISFNCDFVTKFGEPKEMHVKLKYILHENGFLIIGTASTVEEDILQRICESETQVYKLSNYLTHVDIVSQRLASYASKYCDQETFMNLKLCVRELIINAMEHGNLGITFEEKSESLINGTYIQILMDRQKSLINSKKRITVESSLTPEKMEVIITDEGDGFDHEKMLARSMNDDTNGILGHGRGIAMSKIFLDSIVYNEKGNSVRIIKKFK